jgi:hypothetical protein
MGTVIAHPRFAEYAPRIEAGLLATEYARRQTFIAALDGVDNLVDHLEEGTEGAEGRAVAAALRRLTPRIRDLAVGRKRGD